MTGPIASSTAAPARLLLSVTHALGRDLIGALVSVDPLGVTARFDGVTAPTRTDVSWDGALWRVRSWAVDAPDADQGQLALEVACAATPPVSDQQVGVLELGYLADIESAPADMPPGGDDRHLTALLRVIRRSAAMAHAHVTTSRLQAAVPGLRILVYGQWRRSFHAVGVWHGYEMVFRGDTGSAWMILSDITARTRVTLWSASTTLTGERAGGGWTVETATDTIVELWAQLKQAPTAGALAGGAAAYEHSYEFQAAVHVTLSDVLAEAMRVTARHQHQHPGLDPTMVATVQRE